MKLFASLRSHRVASHRGYIFLWSVRCGHLHAFRDGDETDCVAVWEVREVPRFLKRLKGILGMKSTKLVFAASVGLAVAAGCSSSSNSSTGDGGGASDAATRSDVNAQGDLNGMPGMNNCPTTPCASGQICCIGIGASAGKCQDSSASCAGTSLACTVGSCTGGQVCCSTFSGFGGGGGSGPFIKQECTDPGACTGTPICDSTHPCQNGVQCAMFGGTGYCFSLDAGLPPGFLDGGGFRPMPDASGGGTPDAAAATDAGTAPDSSSGASDAASGG